MIEGGGHEKGPGRKLVLVFTVAAPEHVLLEKLIGARAILATVNRYGRVTATQLVPVPDLAGDGKDGHSSCGDSAFDSYTFIYSISCNYCEKNYTARCDNKRLSTMNIKILR